MSKNALALVDCNTRDVLFQYIIETFDRKATKNEMVSPYDDQLIGKMNFRHGGMEHSMFFTYARSSEYPGKRFRNRKILYLSLGVNEISSDIFNQICSTFGGFVDYDDDLDNGWQKIERIKVEDDPWQAAMDAANAKEPEKLDIRPEMRQMLKMDAEDEEGGREPREIREGRQPKEPKENKEGKEGKDGKDAKDGRPPRRSHKPKREGAHGEKPEKAERADKGEKPERADKADKTDKADKSEPKPMQKQKADRMAKKANKAVVRVIIIKAAVHAVTKAHQRKTMPEKTTRKKANRKATQNRPYRKTETDRKNRLLRLQNKQRTAGIRGRRPAWNRICVQVSGFCYSGGMNDAGEHPYDETIRRN